MEMSAAMRAFMFLFTLAHVPLSKCHCNQVAVAKCFTDLLNNWAWDLWKIKEDIAKLDADSCERFENIKNCVNYEGCTKNETVVVSKLVNDLLQHNRDSGTFLQSYYAVEYACKPEGQAVLKSQLECLREHHMGDKLLAEVSRLYDHFAKHKVDTPPEERDETWTADNCNKLTNSADQFDQNTNQKCGDMAGVLICKSFASPFLNIQPELFGFNCAPCEHNEATAEPDVTPILSELDSNEGETDEPAEEEEATTPVVRESGENSEEHHDATVPTVQAATEAPKRQNGAEKLITSFVSLPFALFIILLSFNRA